MNGLHPMEFLLYAVALLLYIFANFRITRLIHSRPRYRKSLVFAAYAGCCFLSISILYAQLNRPHYPEDNLILPYLIVVLCQYGILFLYQRAWKQNLRDMLKLFAVDVLLAGVFVLITGRMEWQIFPLIYSIVKLIAALLLESALRRREKDRIAVQMRMYQHQMEIMEQSQAQIRFLRHDMKNHLLHMNRLLLEHDTDALRDYVQETAAHLDTPQEFVRSGNRDIDSLLNYKLLTAQQLGAEITTDVKIPAEMQIPAFDLNVILGNLLDNALDALKVCDNRRLTVSLRYDAGLLYILIENTCAGEPPAVSAKGAGHGLGLHSIRRTLERYHGELKTDYSDRVFTAAAMLYLDC